MLQRGLLAGHHLELGARLLAPPVEYVVLVERAHVVKPCVARQETLGRGYLRHGVKGAFGLRHPHLLHLPVFEKHLQLGGLGIVKPYERAVAVVDGVIDDEHIVVGVGLVYLSVAEEGEHLVGRHLVVVGRVGQLLNRERLAYDMGAVDGRVFHVDLYHLAKQLLALVPHYGVAVHRKARVLAVVHQRVAHGLHVYAVGPHLVVCVYLAVCRVGVYVVRIYLERVGMHV